MPTTLVAGASRGIGLELCRQLTRRGDPVIAACRTPGADLESLGARIIADIDVADADSVRRLTEQLRDTRVDTLIHNAGILTTETFDDLDFARITRQYQVNALAPLRVAHALTTAGVIADGGKIALVTSRMGSVGDNTSGGLYGYRMSKAALNIAGVNLAHDLRARQIAVILLHPGLVATEMTGGRGIAPAEAAANLIARIDELTLAQSGAFRHASGEPLPW